MSMNPLIQAVPLTLSIGSDLLKKLKLINRFFVYF
jgi:hypothetical protein